MLAKTKIVFSVSRFFVKKRSILRDIIIREIFFYIYKIFFSTFGAIPHGIFGSLKYNLSHRIFDRQTMFSSYSSLLSSSGKCNTLMTREQYNI